MGRRPLPAGKRRDFTVMVKFRPQVKEAIQTKKALMEIRLGEEITLSEFIRRAVWEYCKDGPDDPRQA